MTTFVLTGIAAQLDALGNPYSVSEGTFRIAFPEGYGSASYMLLPTPADELPLVDITSNAYSGDVFGDFTWGLMRDAEMAIGSVIWGNGNETQLLALYTAFDNAEYYFFLGGDALPDITTPTAFEDFNALIDGFAPVSSGPFQEGSVFDLLDVPGAYSTEDDIIDGTDQPETLEGGAGYDEIYGGDGDDSLDGGADDDWLSDIIGGDDTLEGGDGSDTLLAGPGNDLVEGGAGDDSLSGDAGNDTLNGGPDNDDIFAGDGDDLINAGDGDDTVFGSSGQNTINGELGHDEITGGEDMDIISASEGNDHVWGLDGDDTIDVGTGDDTAEGGDGDDVIWGHEGEDSILGGPDDDHLYGGLGDDILEGGTGDDTIDGGAGADFIDGGDGHDIVSYESATRSVRVDLQNPWLMFNDAVGDTFANVEAFQTGGTIDQLRGDAGANEFYTGGLSDRLYGRAGDDFLFGEAGADALYGGTGADTMTGGDDADRRDRYIYFNIVESGVGDGNRDVITDFVSGEDRIEIRRFDADATSGGKQYFDFVGDAGLSGTAGELAYVQTGGNTIIQADVDGDGVADFEIELTGIMDLTAGDFLI